MNITIFVIFTFKTLTLWFNRGMLLGDSAETQIKFHFTSVAQKPSSNNERSFFNINFLNG